MKRDDWVACRRGRGYEHEQGVVSPRRRNFPEHSVGQVRDVAGEAVTVWLIGSDSVWDVPAAEVEAVDVLKTGDKHAKKICNQCHRLLPVEDFAINQRNRHGLLRRPSCRHCRTDIDKRAPKSSQAKKFAKTRPKKGSPFKCPICKKRSIVGITAKVVADHNHHTGDIRDWICDSCNTGLGRFKNGQDCLKDAIEYLRERGE